MNILELMEEPTESTSEYHGEEELLQLLTSAEKNCIWILDESEKYLIQLKLQR